MKKKIWIFAGVIVVLAVVVLLVYPSIQLNMGNGSEADSYETQAAKMGDLVVNVDGVGTLRANQTTTLNWQTGGRVESIVVKTDEMVQSGDTLASLATSSLNQNIIQAASDLVSAQRELDDLKNSNSAKAQAQLDLANTKEEYYKALWDQKYSDVPNVTNKDRIDEARTAVILDQEEVDDALDYYNGFLEYSDSDPTKAKALQKLANAKLTLQEDQNTLNYYLAMPSQFDVQISEGEIEVAKAAYEDAEREWERLKNGPDPEDIAAAEARVAAIQATLDQAKITAPFSGTVTKVSNMIGDQVSAGSTAFRIDDLSRLLVDVPVSEIDINNIKVGQSVIITFDAIQSKEYQGQVTEVSHVGTSDSGTVNFNVTVEVLDADEQVMPGMTAAVNIGTSKLENVLLIPSRAVRTEDGKRVVYVLENGTVVKYEITLGSSADNLSQVLSDNIKKGDLIILNPPSSLDLPTSGPSIGISTFGG